MFRRESSSFKGACRCKLQDVTLVAVFPRAGPIELSVHRELEAAGAQRYNEWFLARPADVIRCVAEQLGNLER